MNLNNFKLKKGDLVISNINYGCFLRGCAYKIKEITSFDNYNNYIFIRVGDYKNFLDIVNFSVFIENKLFNLEKRFFYNIEPEQLEFEF